MLSILPRVFRSLIAIPPSKMSHSIENMSHCEYRLFGHPQHQSLAVSPLIFTATQLNLPLHRCLSDGTLPPINRVQLGTPTHVRYIDDTKTIQKDDTSFSIRLRYWSKVCTIHITIQNTIHFLRNFSIHTRYMNDTKITEIGSVSRARYTAQLPPKPRFCIDCVSKCIEHAFARWIQLWIHVRYGYDTRSIRYDTSYGENAPRYMGKKARRPLRCLTPTLIPTFSFYL